jgi:hypothetical protein
MKDFDAEMAARGLDMGGSKRRAQAIPVNRNSP